MQVSHVEKNMVEPSSTVSNSQIYKEYLNHTLGLTLSTPSLVYIFSLSFALLENGFVLAPAKHALES